MPMSIVDADYSIVLEQLRDANQKGTPDKVALPKAIGVVKDAVSRMGVRTTSTALTTAVAAQFDILDAFTGADSAAAIVAAIATASTLLRADATALIAATPTVPTLLPGGLDG